MGPLGVPELIIIFVVALLVFGPRKLPELGRSLGKGLSEFKRASNDLRATLDDEIRDEERRTAFKTPVGPTVETPAAASSMAEVSAQPERFDYEEPEQTAAEPTVAEQTVARGQHPA
jgi:TatA/E family protein of Tat protein translocase